MNRSIREMEPRKGLFVESANGVLSAVGAALLIPVGILVVGLPIAGAVHVFVGVISRLIG